MCSFSVSGPSRVRRERRDRSQRAGVLPLRCRPGAAYAGVSDTDFEIVRALSGQDLFSQVDARDNTLDFAVFVSQRLWASQTGGARAYATLGTGTSNSVRRT